MKVSIYIGRLLAIFLIAGLVFAPFSTTASAAKDAHKTAHAAMTEMSADMPCCPDNAAPMDCDQCPLMAICMVQNFQAQSSIGFVEVEPVTLRMLLPTSDPAAASLAHLPPPKPPRSLVRLA